MHCKNPGKAQGLEEKNERNRADLKSSRMNLTNFSLILSAKTLNFEALLASDSLFLRCDHQL